MSSQTALQAEVLITTARDRRLVGAVLAPEQLAKLPQLQSAQLMKAAGVKGK